MHAPRCTGHCHVAHSYYIRVFAIDRMLILDKIFACMHRVSKFFDLAFRIFDVADSITFRLGSTDHFATTVKSIMAREPLVDWMPACLTDSMLTDRPSDQSRALEATMPCVLPCSRVSLYVVLCSCPA